MAKWPSQQGLDRTWRYLGGGVLGWGGKFHFKRLAVRVLFFLFKQCGWGSHDEVLKCVCVCFSVCFVLMEWFKVTQRMFLESFSWPGSSTSCCCTNLWAGRQSSAAMENASKIRTENLSFLNVFMFCFAFQCLLCFFTRTPLPGRANASANNHAQVMLISHQWAGRRHPDPKFEQFAILQQASGLWREAGVDL